jgi:hypothetical protein
VNLLNGASLLLAPGSSGVLMGTRIVGDMDVRGTLYGALDARIEGLWTVFPGGALSLGLSNVGSLGTPYTLGSGTITFAAGAGTLPRIASDNLVLGPGVLVHGGPGELVRNVQTSGADNALVNRGTIRADVADTQINIEPTGRFTNHGVLEAANGGILRIGGQWSSDGVIRSNNGSLILAGRFSTGNLGTLERTGGLVTLSAYVDNADSVLTMDTASGPWALDGGTIKNGLLNITGPGALDVLGSTSTFDGLTVGGTLTMGANASLDVRNNLTLNGTIRMAGGGSILRFIGADSQLPSGTVFFDPASGGAERVLTGYTSSSLTLGQGAVVHGGAGQIFTSTTATVINRGLVSADIQSQVIAIYTSRFQNEGTLEAINGGVLEFRGGLAPPRVDLINSGLLRLDSSQPLSVPGSFVQEPGATLEVVLSEYSPASWASVLVVSGTAELDGALRVVMAPGFNPQPGSAFRMFSMSSISGVFASLSLPGLPAGYSWDVSSLYSAGTIGVVPSPGTLALSALAAALLWGRPRRRTPAGDRQ